MTRIEELGIELAAAKKNVLRIKADIRYQKYLDRLRSGTSIAAYAYQFLEACEMGESFRSQDIDTALTQRSGRQQTWTVQGTLRNLCSTGVVLRVSFGRYMAATRKPTNV